MGDASNPTLGIVLPEAGPDVSHQIHIVEATDAGSDWAQSAATNPTVFIHSATTPITDYVSINHDATTGNFVVAGGNLGLEPSGYVQIKPAGSWTANGTSGVLITTMGPTAAGTNVKEWLTVYNEDSSLRYLAAWGT